MVAVGSPRGEAAALPSGAPRPMTAGCDRVRRVETRELDGLGGNGFQFGSSKDATLKIF